MLMPVLCMSGQIDFFAETDQLRGNACQIVLLLNGCVAHVQYRTLRLLKENRMVVLALPAHTSHTTKPVDLSVLVSTSHTCS